jgi:trans-2,3-dihydro-3-hydroxyanthranilate isomerase
MLRLDYEVCDVFTDQALTGNALAVFTDANALDERTMQSLARETNLSESAFVLRPSGPDADARLRIFTPTMELPFAGHPTLGSAFILTGMGRTKPSIRLETSRGIFEVRWAERGAAGMFGWMTQPVPRPALFPQSERTLSALRIHASTLPIEIYDNGPKYVLVEVASAEEIPRLKPDMSALADLGSFAFVVYAREQQRWRVRCFAPGEGIPEDPATGAAAGALVVHLCRHGRAQFGDEISIDQGRELSRPSALHARAHGTTGRVERVEVGGHAVRVAAGQFFVPAK